MKNCLQAPSSADAASGMNREQKALFRQAQLAGLGIVVGGVGLATQRPWLPWIGLFIFMLGLIRFFLIRALIRRSRQWEDSSRETSASSQAPDSQSE